MTRIKLINDVVIVLKGVIKILISRSGKFNKSFKNCNDGVFVSGSK